MGLHRPPASTWGHSTRPCRRSQRRPRAWTLTPLLICQCLVRPLRRTLLSVRPWPPLLLPHPTRPRLLQAATRLRGWICSLLRKRPGNRKPRMAAMQKRRPTSLRPEPDQPSLSNSHAIYCCPKENRSRPVAHVFEPALHRTRGKDGVKLPWRPALFHRSFETFLL